MKSSLTQPHLYGKSMQTITDKTHINIIIISNKHEELKQLSSYTPIYDKIGELGGGLLTYTEQNITFTDLKIPTNTNAHNIELQTVRNNKHITVSNLGTPPLTSQQIDTDITDCL